MKYLFHLNNNEDIIKELETRKITAICNTNFTPDEYLDFENHGLPQQGVKHLVGGNTVRFITKNGRTKLTQKEIDAIPNPHPSLLKHVGTLFNTSIKVYQMNDAELCWRY